MLGSMQKAALKYYIKSVQGLVITHLGGMIVKEIFVGLVPTYLGY